TQRRVEILTDAIAGMFNLMDQGLKSRDLEFTGNYSLQIGPFLARFDAIFTLNQDLFLERKYLPYMSLMGTPGRSSGANSPAIAPPPPSSYSSPDTEVTAHRRPMPKESFLLFPHTQPYFKLHGSSNLYDPDGKRMLVVGGGKSAAISENPLLAWYKEKF